MSKRYVAQLTLKFLFIALCFVLCFGGSHPPSFAQARQYVTVPVVTTEDALQDSSITAINKQLEATDARITSYNQRLDKISDDVSSLGGWVKGVGSGLGLIEVLSIVFNFKKKDI